ncbi:MAG: MATE family efflux transporter [Pseudomonadales bacterium]|jgi:putative MATE family efflux protein
MIIGLPIMGGMVSGVVLGLIDTAMVANLGDAALGAVGFSSFAAFIFLGFFYGFSIAVQATVSRRRGEGESEACGPPLSAGLCIIGCSAPVLSGILYFAVPYLFPLVNSDPEVISIGIDYIRWLILQAAFVGFIAANSGYWNGLGLPRIYLPSLLIMHASNVLFNYLFIFGNFGAPEMGAEGAGFATALSSIVGTILFLFLGFRRGKAYGYLSRLPTREEIRAVLRLAIPAGFQQVLDVAALTCTYAIVGMIGTRELACYSVMINMINLVGLPAWGLGTAGATLVGQSLGEKDTESASQWAWDVLKIGAIAMLILGTPFWLFTDPLLSIWIYDPVTRAIAYWPTVILGAMMCFNGMGYMLAMMLNGAGDVKRVTWINLITQWCILVPGAYLFGVHFSLGLIGLWCVHQFAYRAGHVLIFGYYWRRGDWAKITI